MKQIYVELDGAFAGNALARETPTSLHEFPHAVLVVSHLKTLWFPGKMKV